MISKSGGTKAWIVILLSATIVSCTYRGPAGNELNQQATWFSHLNGDRVRQARACDVRDVREGALVEQMVDRGIMFEAGRPIDAALVGVPTRARSLLSPGEFAEFEDLLLASGAFEPPPSDPHHRHFAGDGHLAAAGHPAIGKRDQSFAGANSQAIGHGQ